MTAPGVCPACGATATGRFCSACGSATTGNLCPECATELSPGARFCHRCGANVSHPVLRRKSIDAALPWAVAAIALVALTALVAGQQFRAGQREPDPPQVNFESPPPDGVVRGPDISQLTPPQRAQVLFDRMQRLNDARQMDSVRFFAPMAIAAFQMLDPIDAEQRFELGRIGVMTGLVDLARAQSDTLLAQIGDQVLGLTLGIQAAQVEGDRARQLALQKRLRTIGPAEVTRNLPRYQRFLAEIEAAAGESLLR